jgi:transposase
MAVFCGIDWSEHHHDVALVDDAGQVLASTRITDDLAGFTRLSELLAEHGGERFSPVDVALETDRGLLVAALRAAGHRVFAINPKAVDRYRDRYAVSGAKSDAADALVLAHLLRTDADRHRPLPTDTEQAAAIGVLARAHQDAVWARTRDVNRLRSSLREFYPAAIAAFGGVLTTHLALRVLSLAPTPTAAAELTEAQLRAALLGLPGGVPASRVRHILTVFAAPQLHQPPAVEQAMGVAVLALVRTLEADRAAVKDLEDALAARFDQHPDAKILRSLPGLGPILGARVLGEFGDDPTRFLDAASRRNYAGTAPLTRASGKSKVVIRRRACNVRLADACRWWAFSALLQSSGARSAYDIRRAAGDSHDAALRRVANRLLGQLHHCLARRLLYDEPQANWPTVDERHAA